MKEMGEGGQTVKEIGHHTQFQSIAMLLGQCQLICISINLSVFNGNGHLLQNFSWNSSCSFLKTRKETEIMLYIIYVIMIYNILRLLCIMISLTPQNNLGK